ncbi:MAG: YfiR family protein [Salinivirgaceae bacterium]|nr:YfiR family protein [Salinivirgaceae bacterium]MDD4746112.1 YfiR family protein [Salinivirgaceae bacterium]
MLPDNNNPIDETSLKVAYIERFTRFVEWPQDSSNEFIIQIIGDTELYDAMQAKFKTHSIKNKKTSVINSSEIDENNLPQLLIIGNINKIENYILKTANKPILTISNETSMCEKGVMINLFIHEKRLRFEVNEQALRNSKLYVNYRLMQMAMRIIYPVNNQNATNR